MLATLGSPGEREVAGTCIYSLISKLAREAFANRVRSAI